MSLIDSLRVAAQSLSVTQASFNIASNNIANVNTPGFSRKTAEVETVAIDGVAAGVRLTDILRQVDAALVRRVQEQTTVLGRLTVRDDFLSRVQQLFGTLADDSSISHDISRLAAAFEDMAGAPDGVTSGVSAVGRADVLADQLNTMTTELQRLRLEADQQIARIVESVNAMLAEIDDLNRQIVGAVNVGSPSGELLDQRDTLVAALAMEIDINVIERTSGEVAIYTKSGRTLVDNGVTTLAYDPAGGMGASVGYGNGINGILYGATAVDITDEFADGRIAALLEVRDELAVDLQAQIDRLAEALRAEVNARHNNGTAYPPPTSLTGTQVVVGTDAPTMTGNFRVTVVDASGEVVETLDIDLTTLADIDDLVLAVDGMANATASIDASGHVVIAATGGNGITVNELDGAVTSGAATVGMAQFLGLNDFFTGPAGYTEMMTDRVASDSAALGLAGNLTFSHNGATTAVAYAAGDSLTAIAASIAAALAAENVSAAVVRDGDGFRLQLSDADGDNLFVADSGAFASQLNLRAGQPGTAGTIQVRATLETNPALVARAESSGQAGLAVGDIALSLGDNAAARALADLFGSDLTLGATGGLPAMVARLSDYATAIVASNAGIAARAADARAAGDSHFQSLTNQAATISQVNLDEEMANIIVLQTAYGAAARVTTTAADMLDLLVKLGT